ncbi:hypothetical protein BG011_002426, partial [Mortierella polycephala]
MEAVTYHVPKSISLSTFVEALWPTFDFEDLDQDYIISACSHPTSDPTIQRLEIVFDESVSKATIARTLIQVGDKRFTPTLAPPAKVTRFVIRNYEFKNNYRADTVQILGNYFEAMGEVIKIEVPVFRMGNTGVYLPNHQVVVYTMGDMTPEEAGVQRDLQLGSHQSRLVQVGWTGAPPFCVYCKQYDHHVSRCPKRLALECRRCHNTGHIAIQCGKYGKRDVTTNKASSPTSSSVSTHPQTPEVATPNPSQSPIIPSSSDLAESEMSDIGELSDMEMTQQVAEHSTLTQQSDDSWADQMEDIDDQTDEVEVEAQPSSSPGNNSTQTHYADKDGDTFIPEALSLSEKRGHKESDDEEAALIPEKTSPRKP